MAFTVPVENYVRSPYPSLPESKERYIQEELKKLERTLGTVSGALGDVEGLLVEGAAPVVPAFSAYQSVSQSVSHNTVTKVHLQSEEFDTDGAFDSATNYRFQPAVEGYYQINGSVGFSIPAVTFISIYKNGVEFKRGVQSNVSLYAPVVSALIYLNGSTDYLEMYGYQASGGSLNTIAAAVNTYFQGVLVRAA